MSATLKSIVFAMDALQNGPRRHTVSDADLLARLRAEREDELQERPYDEVLADEAGKPVDGPL